MNRTCLNCDYWMCDLDDEKREPRSSDTGSCRWRPPVEGAWPDTAADEWCGQWAERRERAG